MSLRLQLDGGRFKGESDNFNVTLGIMKHKELLQVFVFFLGYFRVNLAARNAHGADWSGLTFCHLVEV